MALAVLGISLHLGVRKSRSALAGFADAIRRSVFVVGLVFSLDLDMYYYTYQY
jgi:hypothetical protein